MKLTDEIEELTRADNSRRHAMHHVDLAKIVLSRGNGESIRAIAIRHLEQALDALSDSHETHER